VFHVIGFWLVLGTIAPCTHPTTALSDPRTIDSNTLPS
jgi:hypothetical protein